MAIADLNYDKSEIISGRDGIVIVKQNHVMTSGKTLDVTGWADDYIEAGHPVVFKNGDYFPANPDGSESALAVGIVINTVPKTKPFVGILLGGEVNKAAVKYPVTINADLETQLKLILFIEQ